MRLKYWFRTGLQTFWIILVASAIYQAILFFNNVHMTLEDTLAATPLYLLLFGALLLMAMSTGLYKLNLPLALSFGSTRNGAILGLQIHRLLPAAATVAVAFVLSAVLKQSIIPPAAVIPLGFGLFLAFGALGSVIGMVLVRFGKLGAVLTAVVGMLIGLSGGVMAGLTMEERLTVSLFESGSLFWLMFGIGLLLYSLAMIPEQRLVWKYNVKL